MSLKTDIDQLVADAATVHDWAHGNASHTTTMGGVPVRSPAKLIEDNQIVVNEAAALASTATTQAGIATTQAGIATTQAGIATTQAGIATTQAGIATTKAGESAASAAAALASQNSSAANAGTATTKAGEASSSAAAAAASAAVINLTAPGPIGGTTPSTGAFTTVSASGTVTSSGSSIRVYSTSDGSNGLLFFFNQSGVNTLQMFAGPNEAVFYSGAAVAQKFYTGGVERMRITATGNILIGTTTDDGVNKLQVNGSAAISSTINTGGYTVATLPAAGTAGRRAYVTDATAPTFLGTLTGGGAVKCPVFDNGTAWVAG